PSPKIARRGLGRSFPFAILQTVAKGVPTGFADVAKRRVLASRDLVISRGAYPTSYGFLLGDENFLLGGRLDGECRCRGRVRAEGGGGRESIIILQPHCPLP